jgi:signal transduction histidine kinase
MGKWRKTLLAWSLGAIGTALLLALDIALPRGATAAIGYCAIPLLCATTPNRRLIVITTSLCTLLIWIGSFFEPPGTGLWISLFDRVMVSGALWLTAWLVWRRAEQRRALEAAKRNLEEANAELHNFTSVAAHDVRGPLATISLFNQLIARHDGPTSDPEFREWTTSIEDEVDHLVRLLENLLRHAQTGAVKLSDCDTELVLRQVVQGLRARIQQTAAQVTSDPLPVVRADPMLLGNVLQNLIANAINYRGDSPPRVHVSAERAGGEWVFRVRDNGIGVRAEERERILEPFFQGARARAAGGVGLGLATCKRIIERHGGHIAVEPPAPAGEPGTTFVFTLPIPAPSPAKSPANGAPQAGGAAAATAPRETLLTAK